MLTPCCSTPLEGQKVWRGSERLEGFLPGPLKSTLRCRCVRRSSSCVLLLFDDQRHHRTAGKPGPLVSHSSPEDCLAQLWAWLLCEVPAPPRGCALHLHAAAESTAAKPSENWEDGGWW